MIKERIFEILLVAIYAGTCIVMMATGHHPSNCLILLGFSIGAILSFGFVTTVAGMLLTVASEPETETNGEFDEAFWAKAIAGAINRFTPDWIKEWLGRSGKALTLIFYLIPVFKTTLTFMTLSIGVLLGIGYFFATSGRTLAPDLLVLIGQIAGLYVLYLASMASIRAIEETSI